MSLSKHDAKVIKNLRIATALYKKSAKFYVILAENCSDRQEIQPEEQISQAAQFYNQDIKKIEE